MFLVISLSTVVFCVVFCATKLGSIKHISSSVYRVYRCEWWHPPSYSLSHPPKLRLSCCCPWSVSVSDLGDDWRFDGPDLAPPRWRLLRCLLPWCPLLRQRREGLQVGGDVGFIFRDAAWEKKTGCKQGQTRAGRQHAARCQVVSEEENISNAATSQGRGRRGQAGSQHQQLSYLWFLGPWGHCDAPQSSPGSTLPLSS